ncbi:MAG: hypothetical protein KAR31_08440, partial [Candidatus Omnitrophica bacterium]|nr:hypothetical protein [Candidatus Omnitrophota bacterium]
MFFKKSRVCLGGARNHGGDSGSPFLIKTNTGWDAVGITRSGNVSGDSFGVAFISENIKEMLSAVNRKSSCFKLVIEDTAAMGAVREFLEKWQSGERIQKRESPPSFQENNKKAHPKQNKLKITPKELRAFEEQYPLKVFGQRINAVEVLEKIAGEEVGYYHLKTKNIVYAKALRDRRGNLDQKKVKAILSKAGFNKKTIQETIDFIIEHEELHKKYPHLTEEGVLRIQAHRLGLKAEGKELYRYTDRGDGSFVSYKAMNDKLLYFSLSDGDENGVKSSITPTLAGDMKIDAERYFGEPVSREDLRKVFRNFWVWVEGKAYSLAEGKIFWKESGKTHMVEDSLGYVEAGLLWHKLVRIFPSAGIQIEATSMVPRNGHLETMNVEVKDLSREGHTIEATVVIPIYGRQLEREHNHRHVTSLINEPEQAVAGVIVQPPMGMSEEKGHYLQTRAYYVLAATAQGETPVGTFPTVDSFLGDATALDAPMAVIENKKPAKLTNVEIAGKEAIGALRFKKRKLKPGETMRVIVAMGISENKKDALETFKKYNSGKKLDKAFQELKEFWDAKSKAIQFKTGDKNLNAWLRWVAIQPLLRKIFGCSFLPDHDYGKGGRGWRDLWQDLQSLILIEPEHERDLLVLYFGGVGPSGWNATMIGTGENLFKKDRDGISR